MKKMIQQFSQAIGPSGYESSIRSMIQQEIALFVEDMEVDNLGNLIARKGNDNPGSKKLMIYAHMDEVGLIITHVDGRGFARFAPIGDLNTQALVGSQVQFLNGVRGVIAIESRNDEGKNISIDQLFVDFGATDPSECPVRIGELGVFQTEFCELGNRIAGKALDNRVGVCILIETLQRIQHEGLRSPYELYFVFTTQEQVGSRGAPSAAFRIEPEIGIKVGLLPSGDTPKGLRKTCELGKGPAITIRDAYAIADSRVIEWISQTASEEKIPHQFSVIERSFSEADTVQLTRTGAATGGVYVPARYIHSGMEMVDLEDVALAANLLKAMIMKPVEL